MIETGRLSHITGNEISNYKQCIQKMICSNPTPSCHLRKCATCPGPQELKSQLEINFEEMGHSIIDKVQFKLWDSTDRCKLKTFGKPVSGFIELLCTKIEHLITHHFIKTQQHQFINEQKDSLKTSEFWVMADFSEN